VVVVSNQSGVARGYFPELLVLEVNELMKLALAKDGARLDGIYYCPHISADGCDCRKPNIGMMQRAERELGLQTAARLWWATVRRYGDGVSRRRPCHTRAQRLRTG